MARRCVARGEPSGNGLAGTQRSSRLSHVGRPTTRPRQAKALSRHPDVLKTAAELSSNLRIWNTGPCQLADAELRSDRFAFGGRDGGSALGQSDVALTASDQLGNLPVVEPLLCESHNAGLPRHPFAPEHGVEPPASLSNCAVQRALEAPIRDGRQGIPRHSVFVPRLRLRRLRLKLVVQGSNSQCLMYSRLQTLTPDFSIDRVAS